MHLKNCDAHGGAVAHGLPTEQAAQTAGGDKRAHLAITRWYACTDCSTSRPHAA